MGVKTHAIWIWKCGPIPISATEEYSRPCAKCPRLTRICTMGAANSDSMNCSINPPLPRATSYTRSCTRSWKYPISDARCTAEGRTFISGKELSFYITFLCSLSPFCTGLAMLQKDDMLIEVCPNLHSSKLTHYHMDYMTGHHERRKDAPDTAGCISMDIHPGKQDWQPVIPLSTV